MTRHHNAVPRAALVLVLLCALATPAMAARRRSVCVAVAIEGIPSLVCGLPARRR